MISHTAAVLLVTLSVFSATAREPVSQPATPQALPKFPDLTVNELWNVTRDGHGFALGTTGWKDLVIVVGRETMRAGRSCTKLSANVGDYFWQYRQSIKFLRIARRFAGQDVTGQLSKPFGPHWLAYADKTCGRSGATHDFWWQAADTPYRFNVGHVFSLYDYQLPESATRLEDRAYSRGRDLIMWYGVAVLHAHDALCNAGKKGLTLPSGAPIWRVQTFYKSVVEMVKAKRLRLDQPIAELLWDFETRPTNKKCFLNTPAPW